jgi:hypothetical protein
VLNPLTHNPAAVRVHLRRYRLALAFAVILFLLRITRANADENTAGYRREWYIEDNDRIKVETDTFNFDTALGPKVRANGLMVFDSISGATPTGAPPQTQWPFPTFDDFYKQAFKPAFDQAFQKYVADNIIFVNAGLETGAQMTNKAIAFANTQAKPAATSAATTQFSSLTNNPDFRNSTVPLTQMHEFRTAFSLGLPITLNRQELTPSVSFSAESDYVSRGVALNDAIGFNNKNTTLNLGYSGNWDIVRDQNLVWESKTTHDFLLGVNQLLTPKSYLTANATFGTEWGYLADPYRGVMFAQNFPQTNPSDAALTPEVRPRHRSRAILYLGYTHFIDPLNGSAELSYRYFHDSWQVNAHTVDFRWNQKLGKRLVISPMFRYYYQTASSFYYVLVPDFDNKPSFFSSDYRLSEFNSFAMGVKLTYRIQRHVSLDAGYMRYIMRGLDNATSQSAYPQAHVVSLGFRLWF